MATRRKSTTPTDGPKLAIEYWDIERIRPYKNNARMHSPAQVKQIAASIERFKFMNPVLVGDDGTIIAGHGRVEAAKQLGMKELPVLRFSHLTAAERRAFVIADNKIAENSSWNTDILREEFGVLKGDDFDLAALGFTDSEVLDVMEPERQRTQKPEDIVDYQYRVIVECEGEQQQAEVATMLEGKGFKCRLLIS